LKKEMELQAGLPEDFSRMMKLCFD